jgi:hypothetical protein
MNSLELFEIKSEKSSSFFENKKSGTKEIKKELKDLIKEFNNNSKSEVNLQPLKGAIKVISKEIHSSPKDLSKITHLYSKVLGCYWKGRCKETSQMEKFVLEIDSSDQVKKHGDLGVSHRRFFFQNKITGEAQAEALKDIRDLLIKNPSITEIFIPGCSQSFKKADYLLFLSKIPSPLERINKWPQALCGEAELVHH